MESSFLILPGDVDDKTPCAVRIEAPTDVDRISTHIILLIDISESMLDDKKLENVKKCCELLLTFLNDTDAVSLITFGDYAKLHLKSVAATEANKTAAQQTIKNLFCDGCTNLSAGLGYINEVYEASTLKTGLLILTDGHANRGVSNPDLLRSMISSIRERNNNLSISCVAYGDDHNADLLRNIAEDVQGAYTIVRGIEDVAMAFGDTLGGLMSCAFQNVELDVPKDTIVHSPNKITMNGDRKKIHIGDVYAGTKPLILLDIPKTVVRSVNTVILRGNKLPELTTIQFSLIPEVLEERDVDIDITRHRYTCAKILNSIRGWASLSIRERNSLKGQIDILENNLNDEFFNGHPVANLLKSEIPILRTALENAIRGGIASQDHTVLTQHVATVGLGRGFSSPMNVQRSQPQHRIFGGYNNNVEAMDPVGIDESSNAFQNRLQAAMSIAMRTASQQVTNNPSQ